MAVRTDENKSYILNADDPTVLANWVWLRTPDCKVLSVNSKTGAVVLTTSDIAEGANLYFTEARYRKLQLEFQKQKRNRIERRRKRCTFNRYVDD